jgi:hypothetical protein
VICFCLRVVVVRSVLLRFSRFKILILILISAPLLGVSLVSSLATAPAVVYTGTQETGKGANQGNRKNSGQQQNHQRLLEAENWKAIQKTGKGGKGKGKGSFKRGKGKGGKEKGGKSEVKFSEALISSCKPSTPPLVDGSAGSLDTAIQGATRHAFHTTCILFPCPHGWTLGAGVLDCRPPIVAEQ